MNDFIGIYDDVFSEQWCKDLIEYFHKMEASGLTYTRKQQKKGESRTRRDDNQLYWVTSLFHENVNPIFHVDFYERFWGIAYDQYANKYDMLERMGRHDMISPKMQRTGIGQGYHVWHCENETLKSFNRLLAYTVYLNDVDEGGETEFLYYPMRIKAKTGRVAIWPAGFTHTHRGNPPISNEKYIINGWLNMVGGEDD